MSRLIFLQLNELNFPYVESYVEQGYLPNFERLLSDHLTGLLRNLYTGQQATVRNRHRKNRLANWERNGMDLTEAENIKTRCEEYTEELYKKDLND